MDLTETRSESTKWIKSAQNGNRWRVAANREFNLRIAYTKGDLLPSWKTIRLSRTALLHELIQSECVGYNSANWDSCVQLFILLRSVYLASKSVYDYKMVILKTNCKEHRRKRSWFNLMYVLLSHLPEGTEEDNTEHWITGVPAEIWSQHVPNTNQKPYRWCPLAALPPRSFTQLEFLSRHIFGHSLMMQT